MPIGLPTALLAGLLGGPPPAAGIPFVVRFTEARYGLQAGCVIEDAPPKGAWTVHFTVLRPNATDLNVGDALCAIVESPALYQKAAVGEGGIMECLAVPASRPTLFRCTGAPQADQTILTAAQVKTGQGRGDLGQLKAELAALEGQAEGLRGCKAAARELATADYFGSLARRSLEDPKHPGMADLLEMAPVLRADLAAAGPACAPPRAAH
jgi:hypothetical protein